MYLRTNMLEELSTMSEKAPKSGELHTPEENRETLIVRKEPEQNKDHGHHKLHEQIESIQKNVEKHSTSSEEIVARHQEKDKAEPTPTTLPKDLQSIAFRRSMIQIRRHLSKSEQSFSKVVHQPVVDRVSNIASKTIARPSGILWGAAFMFIGSVLLLIISKRYGFTYNYLVGLIFLITGYIFGCFIELLYKIIIKIKG